ncbi:hypothetical protein N599_31120 [Saccharopolyspora erythraea D]|nr:hypothetical protein N599_31120 [Saccharopolyspora erythraea D]
MQDHRLGAEVAELLIAARIPAGVLAVGSAK